MQRVCIDFSFHLSVLGGWLSFLTLIYRDCLFFNVYNHSSISRFSIFSTHLRHVVLLWDPSGLCCWSLILSLWLVCSCKVINFPLFLYQWSELNVLKSFSAQAQARLSVRWMCSRHLCLRLNKNRRVVALENISVRKKGTGRVASRLTASALGPSKKHSFSIWK